MRKVEGKLTDTGNSVKTTSKQYQKQKDGE